MYNRITTKEIYDILVEKKATTFYAGNIKLKIKFSKDECLTAYLGENCVAYIRKRGDEEKALNEFYEYTHKIASRFNGTVKFVMRLSNSVKDRYIETHLDKSWKKEAVKICDKEDEVFTKVFVS